MSLTTRNFGSSSSGAGIRVSLTDGKRFEEFLNTSSYWYYAEEVVIGSSFNSDTIKAPQLGRLTIHQRNQDKKNSKDFVVAVFPKGSWEFVRILEGEVSTSDSVVYKDPDEDSRNNCPEGCWVQGWEDLGSETKKAHMDFNHTGGRKIYPN